MTLLASIHLCYAGDSACPFHRLLLPARFCAPAFERAGHEFTVGDGLPEGSDWYAVHGIPGNTQTIIEVGKLKACGCRFLWSIDDDWMSIPDWNPAKLNPDGVGVYGVMTHMADAFLVSTPELVRVFERFGKPVHLGPNLLDLSQFPNADHETGAAGRRDVVVKLPVRVCWVGGHTHRGDVAVMAEGLSRLMAKYGPRDVNVVFFGMQPPHELTKRFLHRNLTWQPAAPFPLYQATVNALKPNVYLAPLADIPFNLSKSNLRVMEGWALNAAVVASPVGEYRCIRSGEDGRYAHDPDEWFSAVERVTTDHQYRFDLAAAGRARVREECDWNRPACRRPWVEAFAKILDVPVPEDV